MSGNHDGLRILAKYTNLPVDRIKYFPEGDESIINSIQRGILFLMAFWSGTSVRAFAEITEVLGRLDANAEIDFVVVDVDGSPALYDVPEFLGKVHGNGEAAWVRNGNIIATSGVSFNPDCFEPNTASLLLLP